MSKDEQIRFASDADRKAWETDFMAYGQAVVDQHGKHVPLVSLHAQEPARKEWGLNST